MRPVIGLGVLVILAVSVGGHAAAANPAAGLPRSSPEAQGISSKGILSFVDAADDKIDSLHGFVLVRHGKVVAEGWWAPYDAGTPHELYSLSKSFTSTAVGLAAAEGKVSVDDEVLKFFPDDAPAEPTANLKAMRVRDLLTMSTGHQDETSSAADQITARSFLAHPVPHKPGSHFRYNTPATFMLSAIVQKVTGQPVLEYLRPRLFEPLGIENPTWATNAQGISLGGYGLSLRTMDIARFGQLYLQKGKWQGRQVVPAAWVDAATTRQMSNGSNPSSDWDQGYGFQFWRSRHGAYRGDGAFGQYCLVMPAQDAVIAMTAGVTDMPAVLNLIWQELFPAMQPRALARDGTAQSKLADRLAHLSLRPVRGQPTSPIAARIAGTTFAFPANEHKVESVLLDAGKPSMLTFGFAGRTARIELGNGEWKTGRVQLPGTPERAVAASGAWVADDTYVAKLCFPETPFTLTVTMRFADGQVSYEQKFNVGFKQQQPTPIVGRAAAS
jgi:CubicO group peptidase (beta-lactamase class C family)